MLDKLPTSPTPSSGHSPCWPAHWITLPNPEGRSYVVAYKLEFSVEQDGKYPVRVTADQRYRLFLDGKRVGEGPERGSPLAWHYESYDLDLKRGRHVIVALVWTNEKVQGLIPAAQMSMRHGFLFSASGSLTETLCTGLAPWSAKQLSGVSFALSGLTGAGLDSGPVTKIDGATFPWGIKLGEGDGWQEAQIISPGRSGLSRENWGLLEAPRLVPASLPAQVSAYHPFTNVRHVGTIPDDIPLWVAPGCSPIQEADDLTSALREGRELRVEPHRKLWLLVDLDDYFCGYPELTALSGRGTRISVLWAESLFEVTEGEGVKGNRDEIEGKVFTGRGDHFVIGLCDREETYTSFWWNCGRYVAILIETAAEPLRLKRLGFRETRYPYDFNEENISIAHDGFMRSRKLMVRGLQMCAHETFMDCPYYEQLNYAGDTRVQALSSYVLTWDDRLPVKCIEMFRLSLLPTGVTQSRYPSNIVQVIPQFSLYWVNMLYDLALWRGHRERIRGSLPVARCVIDTFLNHIGDDGLLRCPEGWDWIDWAWRGPSRGHHPVGPEGVSSANHLQLVYTLEHAAKLEQWAGQLSRAEQYLQIRQQLWDRALEVFWNEEAGLFAATSVHDTYSEHSQCYAALTGLLDENKRERLRQGLTHRKDLVKATYYFQFYLFAALARLGMHDEVLRRLDDWGGMADLGLRTPPERPEPTRSDCHAWSAHPLYHAVVSFAGVRPGSFNFDSLVVSPAIHALSSAAVSTPHRLGTIHVEWQRLGDRTNLSIEVPQGLEAMLDLPGVRQNLTAGRSCIEVETPRLPYTR